MTDGRWQPLGFLPYHNKVEKSLSSASALRHSAWLAERQGDLQLRGCGPAREQDVSPHVFLHFFALCTPGTRESLAAPNLEHDYLTLKTGRMWLLWIAWQSDAEAATGGLEGDSALKDLAVRGECSRADMYIYLCLFVFTLILYTYEMTCICIRCNSWQLF